MKRVKQWWEVGWVFAVTVGGIFAASVVAEAVSDLGDRTRLAYFEVAAQIIPVLLLATMVEVTVSFSRVKSIFEMLKALETRDVLAESEELAREVERAVHTIRREHPQEKEVLQDYEETLQKAESLVDVARRRDEEDIPRLRRQVAVIRGQEVWEFQALAAAAGLGEWSALSAVARGHSTTFFGVATTLSMIALFAMLFSYFRTYRLNVD